MTALHPDLILVQRKLMHCVEREISRGQRRARLTRRVAILAACILVLATSALGASSELRDSARSMMSSVFQGEATVQPSNSTREQFDGLVENADDVPAEMSPGDLDSEASGRVVFQQTVEGVSVQMYARPTARDGVCYTARVEVEGQQAGGGGGCVEDFDASFPAEYSGGTGADRAPMLHGITSDQVQRVSVVTETGSHPAVMGDNSFVWVGGRIGDHPVKVVLILADGTRVSKATGLDSYERKSKREMERLRKMCKADLLPEPNPCSRWE